jgi:hypothetical protein
MVRITAIFFYEFPHRIIIEICRALPANFSCSRTVTVPKSVYPTQNELQYQIRYFYEIRRRRYAFWYGYGRNSLEGSAVYFREFCKTLKFFQIYTSDIRLKGKVDKSSKLSTKKTGKGKNFWNIQISSTIPPEFRRISGIAIITAISMVRIPALYHESFKTFSFGHHLKFKYCTIRCI